VNDVQPQETGPISDRRRGGHDSSSRRAALARLEVLVVDDDPDSRELVALAVRSHGHRCRVAGDGTEALKLLAERPADLVISDWAMPEMSGAELCRRVRDGGDDVPYTYFIIMTAFDDREHLLAGMAAGADDYQRKPVRPDELEGRLISAQRVVEHHRRLEARTANLLDDSTRHYEASRTDALTGVANRMRLDEEIATLLSRARRYGHTCSLAICDVDHFKAYNDRFGHVAGDDALRSIADGMRLNLRSADALFRYGGEEFVVLLIEQSLAEAERAMERMRVQIERLGIPSARGGPLTVSVGVAELDPASDRSGEDWIARADAALYEAKARGRNRVVSTPPPGM
jgi:two-component system chemotaxis response regulator CheY